MREMEERQSAPWYSLDPADGGVIVFVFAIFCIILWPKIITFLGLEQLNSPGSLSVATPTANATINSMDNTSLYSEYMNAIRDQVNETAANISLRLFGNRLNGWTNHRNQ